MNLSKPQVEVLRHAASDDMALFAGGAVRSGKSYSVLMSFAVWMASQEASHDHAIVGQSIESCMRNCGFDLLEALNDIPGCSARLDKKFGTCIMVHGLAEQRIWIIGANDAKARRRIQGATLKGLIVEELTLLPEDFWNMSLSRLSVDGAKLWASFNPEGPSHWAKRKVIDRCQDFKGKVLHFKMRDNPTLTPETIARYEASFTGHFYRRLIEGEWSAAEGACYPEWFTTSETCVEHGQWHLALDWAVSGTLAAFAISAKGPRAIVSAELYHEGRTGGVLTENAVADRIVAWFQKDGRLTYTSPAWVDPSAPNSFKRLLRNAGFRVMSADNNVVPGIVTTGARLSQGSLLINESCTQLKAELASYVWDDVAAEHGEDKPLKKADHGPDALRYFAHSTGKAYRYNLATTVEEALQ